MALIRVCIPVDFTPLLKFFRRLSLFHFAGPQGLDRFRQGWLLFQFFHDLVPSQFDWLVLCLGVVLMQITVTLDFVQFLPILPQATADSRLSVLEFLHDGHVSSDVQKTFFELAFLLRMLL